MKCWRFRACSSGKLLQHAPCMRTHICDTNCVQAFSETRQAKTYLKWLYTCVLWDSECLTAKVASVEMASVWEAPRTLFVTIMPFANNNDRNIWREDAWKSSLGWISSELAFRRCGENTRSAISQRTDSAIEVRTSLFTAHEGVFSQVDPLSTSEMPLWSKE